MRRTVLIVPSILSEASGDSFLRQSLPALSVLSELGRLRKVAAVPPSETPEAMLLGLGPTDVVLRQGPLTVSALGFDPPERSTHFHLSLMSFQDGVGRIPPTLPLPGEVELLMAAAKRLDTKTLTMLKGEGFDHGLVWESIGDLGTTSAQDANGHEIRRHLPDGDGDVALRRLIDDSINLLSSLELNERRLDQGLPPFNMLWPWGNGLRMHVPNLALRRGEPAVVESASMRLSGLTRLAGYKHSDRASFGKGLATKLRSLAGRCLSRELTIAFIDVAEELRSMNKPEELDWFIRELDRELLQPLLEDHLKTPSRLALMAPGPISPAILSPMPASPIGLAISVQTGFRSDNIFPFDERSLDEKTVPSSDLWRLVAAAVE